MIHYVLLVLGLAVAPGALAQQKAAPAQPAPAKPAAGKPAPKAKPKPTPATPTVEKVLEYYQTEELLADVMPIFEEAMTRRRKEITIADARADQILSLAGRIYKKKNLYSVFKVAYSKATTMENMTALYRWQLTTKGIRLRQAYAEHYKTNWAMWEKALPKDIKPNRKNAITTYITTTKQSDLYVGMQVGSDLGVYMALNAMAPAASRESDKVIKDKMKKRRPGFMQTAQERLLVYDYSLFKEFKNEEIDEMSKFATTPAGFESFEAYNKALEQTMEAAAKTLANEILKGTK